MVTFPPEILMAKTYGIRAALWLPGAGILDRQDGLMFNVQEVASLCNSNPEGRAGQIAVRCNWVIGSLDDTGARHEQHIPMAQPRLG